MVTTHELCARVLTDAETFTVDDERFSTRRVVGSSMLSLDGPAHALHRSAFAPDFRRRHVHDRLEDPLGELLASLATRLAPLGEVDLRSAVALPTAAEMMQRALGLDGVSAERLIEWNTALISAIDGVTEGGDVPSYGTDAFERLKGAVGEAMGDGAMRDAAERAGLPVEGMASNVAVLLIGGIVTSEGAMSIAFRHLLDRPALMGEIRQDSKLVDRFLEESLRYEPAAAFLDRYATRDVVLGNQSITAGDLVRVSIAGANRDPLVFEQPNLFDVSRANPSDHLTFARGPHTCLGIHLAKLEIRTAILVLLRALPGLSAAPGPSPSVGGLIFRAPDQVPAIWAGDSATLS